MGKHGKVREEESSASPGKRASFRKSESYVLAYVTYIICTTDITSREKGGEGVFFAV